MIFPFLAEMDFPPEDLTRDAFLGGQLQIWQPRHGYRAGIDPVLLAASVRARPGQSVLDLGCGAGVASLCLARRVGDLHVVGVEVQPAYAALARRNIAENMDTTMGTARVFEADLRALPSDLKAQEFDHVIANPPYFMGPKRMAARDSGREAALAGDTPLRDWIDVATRRLRPKGWLSIVQDATRLPDLLAACDGRLGSIELFVLTSRHGRAAHRVILRARKGGRAPFRLNAPIIMHEGSCHTGDKISYTDVMQAVLRNGAPLFDPT